MQPDNSNLTGRIRDLANKAYQSSIVTHTDFLSVSEIAEIRDSVPRDIPYVFWGGHEEAERCELIFLPDWVDVHPVNGTLTDPEDIRQLADLDILTCLQINPVNARFAEDLNHRDILGALMNLGIERDQIGDILTEPGKAHAYLFTTTHLSEVIQKELFRIRHTSVKCEAVSPMDCDIQPQFEEIEGSVASERLDAILAFVYRLSRGEAQRYIEQELVFVDGRTAFSGGYDLKPGSRVSVRGKGKFIYDGQEGTTRKGRLFLKVRKYS